MKTRFGGTLKTTAQTIFICANNESARVDLIWVSNATSSNHNFTLHHVQSQDVAAANNALQYQTIVRANISVQMDGPVYLRPGDSLQALASANDSINLHVYVAMVGADYETDMLE